MAAAFAIGAIPVIAAAQSTAPASPASQSVAQPQPSAPAPAPQIVLAAGSFDDDTATAATPRTTSPAATRSATAKAGKTTAAATTPRTPSTTATVAPAPASAAADIGYLTGTALVQRCKQSDASSTSYCFAYIAAVTDTVRAYEIWLGSREFCLPANTAQADIRRGFLTYVSVYPDRAAGQAASVVVNALKETYPCG